MKTEPFGRRKYPVDIIVRCCGQMELTQSCVGSIVRNTAASLYRLTIVENMPEGLLHKVTMTPDVPIPLNASTMLGMDNGEWFQYVRLATNMGAVRASNVGFMLSYLSPAEFILILDNDARIPDGDKDWLERWMKHFDDPEVGAAGATSDRVAGYQQIQRTPETYLKEWVNTKSGDHGETAPIFVPWLISFACMYRKEAMAKIVNPRGLWDERFEPGNSEDVDASLRLREAGYKCALAHDIYVHHDMSKTFTANFDFGELLKTNHAKLVKKWGQEKLNKMGVTISYE